MGADERIGVVLFQLGGPDSLETIEPFLYNLFSDPDIIDLPFAFLFRKPLARLISSRRALKVQEYYRMIGGKSPMTETTGRQAEALERELSSSQSVKVYVAMRYWYPFTDEAVEAMKQDGITRAVLLPLYPQYSVATTGSSLHEWERSVERKNFDVRYSLIDEYSDHPMFVEAIVECIKTALDRVPPPYRRSVHLVFSAHGTPVKLVKRGDPYQQQILRTCQAVMERGEFGLPHTICYQSKVGPENWLEPSFDATIERLAAEKTSHMIIIPVAFVSDHIETLHEINIKGREEAHQLGIAYYDMTPALDTNPRFIGALADLVRKKIHES